MARSDRGKGRHRERRGLPPEDLDDALDNDRSQGLVRVFINRTAGPVPAGFMGASSLLGRLHREHKDRSEHSPDDVRLARSIEIAIEAGPSAKRSRFNDRYDLIEREATNRRQATPEQVLITYTA